MTLSMITKSSINDISKQEISTLANCNLENEVIAVTWNVKNSPKIITLSKKDITCWQLFLRFFGWGKLAKTELHLKDVTSYLNKYDWSTGVEFEQTSDQYKAYLKVCMLANKAICSKSGMRSFFDNVSTETMEKRITLSKYLRDEKLGENIDVQSIKWNPAMQIKHVAAQLTMQYRKGTIHIKDENHHYIDPNSKISRTLLDNARIYIEKYYVSI
jgi:hypothetical protein